MKGSIVAIKQGEIHDGDGIRTTVFFKGCPLRCIWCHNPETLSFKSQVGYYSHKCIGCGCCQSVCPNGSIRMEAGRPVTDRQLCSGCMACADLCPTEARMEYGIQWDAETLAQKLLEDKPFFDSSGGGVTLSGGECLAQPEFATALAKALWERKVSVDIDTCGHVKWEILQGIMPYVDTFLYDLKAIDPAVHKHCTGVENRLILQNLRSLQAQGCRIEIRYPYVPGYNDGEAEKIGAFLKEIGFAGKIKVLGYHNLAGDKYTALDMENRSPDAVVTADMVQKPVDLLLAMGLHAVNGMKDN